jgi:small multidrug resistance pump
MPSPFTPTSAGLLAAAIASEIVATSSLKASAGFTRLGPSAAVIAGYATAFYCLSLCLKTVPIGIAYAIWSGVGTAVVALIGFLAFRERLHPAQVAGIALIIAGVALLRLYAPAEAS